MSFIWRARQGACPVFAGVLILGVSACSMKGWQPASTSAFKIQFAPTPSDTLARFDLAGSVVRMFGDATTDPLFMSSALGTTAQRDLIDYACLMVDVVKQGDVDVGLTNNGVVGTEGPEKHTQLTFGEFLNSGNQLISQDDYLNSADGTPGIPAEWKPSLASCVVGAHCKLRVWAVRQQIGIVDIQDATGKPLNVQHRANGSMHDSYALGHGGCALLSTDPGDLDETLDLQPATNDAYVFNQAPFPTLYLVAEADFNTSTQPESGETVIEVPMTADPTVPYGKQSYLVGLGHHSELGGGSPVYPVPSSGNTDFVADVHHLTTGTPMLASDKFTFNMRGSLSTGPLKTDAGCADSGSIQALAYPDIIFTDVDAGTTKSTYTQNLLTQGPYFVWDDVFGDPLIYTKNHVKISRQISTALPLDYDLNPVNASLYLMMDNASSAYHCTVYDTSKFTYTLAPTIVLRPPGTL